MFGQLNLWLGAGAGAALMLVTAWGYDKLVDDPLVVRETTAQVEAKARELTLNAINEVTDEAQRARAMRRYCLDSGRMYSFSTGKCR